MTQQSLLHPPTHRTIAKKMKMSCLLIQIYYRQAWLEELLSFLCLLLKFSSLQLNTFIKDGRKPIQVYDDCFSVDLLNWCQGVEKSPRQNITLEKFTKQRKKHTQVEKL